MGRQLERVRRSCQEVLKHMAKPGPNKRVFAFLIDVLVARVLAELLSLLGMDMSWLIIIVYILCRDGYKGISIGKSLANLQVVDERQQPINIGQSLIRNIPMAIPLFPLVEYFVSLHDPLGKRIGDKAAKTQVTDLRPGEKETLYLILSIAAVIVIVAVTTIAKK